jgi:type II secretory pathway predicted ATPase ExeA
MYGVPSILALEDRRRLSDGMEPLGLSKSLRHVDACETDPHRQRLQARTVAIHEGGIMALTGMVGRGKTVCLGRLQEQRRQEGQIAVAEALPVDVPRVNLATLTRALYYAWATDPAGALPRKTDKSERACMQVLRRCPKPSGLLVEDGHEVPGQTRRGLKQLREKTRRRGARLTMVFAGHPRLTHDLRRPSQEETGARATVLECAGIQGHQRRSSPWLLAQGAPAVAPSDLATPDALERLAERLLTPLHIQPDLTRLRAQAHRLGEKPVPPTLVHAPLAPDMPELEPTLTR